MYQNLMVRTGRQSPLRRILLPYVGSSGLRERWRERLPEWNGTKNLSGELSDVTGATYVVALGALRDSSHRPPEAGVAAQNDPVVGACPKGATPKGILSHAAEF